MKHDELLSPLNALVIGWYGAPNVGDEVLLEILKTSIESKGGAITVASVDPALTHEMHGVESVDFHNLGEVAHALLWADVLIMGGGGIFQDHHPFHLHPVYDPVLNDISAYARPILMARQFGVPVVIWGHGVGPLAGPEAKEVVRDIFNGVMAVSVRDEKSLELLRKIGVDRPVEVGADPGWLYKRCCVHDASASMKEQGGKKALVIVIREWSGKYGDWKRKLVTAIDKVVDDEWQIRWVAFQANIRASGATSDWQLIDDIRKDLPEHVRGEVLLPRTPLEAWDMLASADAIFSMRLHASILGLLAKKPLVGLEYDDKMRWAHEMAGLPAVMRLQLSDPEERYVEGLRAAMGQAGTPWTMGDSRIAQLEESASVHLTMLDHISIDSGGKKHWAGGQFDWLATWLQQAVADLRETKERSLLAHELLQYRDVTLSERDAELGERGIELASLRGELADVSLKCDRVETALGESRHALAKSNDELDLLEMEFKRKKAQRENLVLPDNEKQNENENAADLNERLRVLRMELREILDEVDQKSAYIADKEVYIAQLIGRIDELEGRMVVIEHELHEAQNSWLHVRQLMAGMHRRLVRVLKMPFEFLALCRRHGLHFALRQTAQRFRPEGIRGQATIAVGHRERVTVVPQPVRNERLLVICHAVMAHGWPTRSASFVKAAVRAGFFVRWCSSTSLPDRDQMSPDITLVETNEVALLDEVRAEVTRVLLADLSPSSLMLAKSAKERGAQVILDLSSVDLDVLSIEQFAELTSFISRAVSREGVADARLPMVEVQCLPDGADDEEFDSYKAYAYPDSFRKRRRNILVFVAGSSAQGQLKDLLSAHPLGKIHVVGHVAIDDDRVDKVFWEPSARASILAASDVVVVISDGADVTDDIRQSVRSALIMERPVISNVSLHVGSSKNLHLLNGRTLAQVIDSVDPVEDYGFVSANAWLGRVEQLMQGNFPCSVSVVVLIHNNRKIVERCVSTMLFHCSAWIHEIVVVDNQSSDGGAEFVEELYAGHPKVKLVRNSENGCSSGRNLGVKKSTGEYIAFFDSDQWLTSPSSFAEAIHVLETNTDVGTIGWNAGWFDARRNDLGGAISDYVSNRGMNADALLYGYRDDIGFLGTSGMFIKRALFERIEGFDTFYDPTCFEDTDICFQIKKAGYAVAFRDLAGIRHQPHQTTGASEGSERYRTLFARNAEYFRKKWEGSPEFFVDYVP
jgi:polysaccharide pyruvyl transferase CsaB